MSKDFRGAISRKSPL